MQLFTLHTSTIDEDGRCHLTVRIRRRRNSCSDVRFNFYDVQGTQGERRYPRENPKNREIPIKSANQRAIFLKKTPGPFPSSRRQ